MRIEITRDCCCEGDRHELMYPRKGLIVRKFKVGDELEFEKEWANFYGRYYRCKPRNDEHKPIDIAVNNARFIG